MRGWAIPAAMIVAVEYVAALLIGQSVGFRYSIPADAFLIIGLTIGGVGVIVGICAKMVRYVRQNEPNPSRRLVSELPDFAPFVVGTTLVALQIAVLNWTKVMLPMAAGFWADEPLANFDQMLFTVDPWIISHELFGWASAALDRGYATWAPLKFATLLVVLALPESKQKTQALPSYFLIMFTGAIGQYAMPSAGPLFYDRIGLGARFASIPLEPWVVAASDYLWVDHLKAGGNVGGGISAMPSMHVAIAVWIALVVRAYVPRVQVLGWLYASMVLIGSVHLGWHYAADGIVSVVIALSAWALASVPRHYYTSKGSGAVNAAV